MKMRAEQGVAGYAPQVARPQNADVQQMSGGPQNLNVLAEE